MGKQYDDVIEMVKDLSKDSEFNKSLEEEIKSRQISKILFAMRCRGGLTQSQIAKKMKCSQGRVSKIENSYDKELTIRDLIDYCSAINMRVEIGFSNLGSTLADKVKFHYFKIRDLLDRMLDLARGDKTIEAGVEKFTKEAFVNISFGLLECLRKPKMEKTEESLLYVSEPINSEDFSDDKELIKKECTYDRIKI
ncbi:MAG: helix-turn-helix domain-containing protein [Candidatus Kuenenia sp.]|nr:helix-turn-helix domain-containing protein [Candidatus Kuenenia sp.]